MAYPRRAGCIPKAVQAEQVAFPWKPCICSCVRISTWHSSFRWPSQMRQFVLRPLEAELASVTPYHASRIIEKRVLVSFRESDFPLGPRQRSHNTVLRQAAPYPSHNCYVFCGQSSFLSIKSNIAETYLPWKRGMLFTQGRKLAVYYQRVFSEQIFNQDLSYLSFLAGGCSWNAMRFHSDVHDLPRALPQAVVYVKESSVFLIILCTYSIIWHSSELPSKFLSTLPIAKYQGPMNSHFVKVFKGYHGCNISIVT